MSAILILDNQHYRREKLVRYLSDAAYDVFGIDGYELPNASTLSGINLVVLNLHPDADRTWEMYFWFKQQHPIVPVIVYAKESFQAFRSLKQVTASVLNLNTGLKQGTCTRSLA